MREIVIGSRESRLAVAQTEILCDYIRKNCPEITPRILTMKTTGDKILNRKLADIGGKGLFVKELDAALSQGKSHLSLHSLKDLPMEVSPDFPILGYSKREDPRDVLVLPLGSQTLDKEKPIGSSSPRRILQLKNIFPDMETSSVRGNVLTRLKKLDAGEYSALVLAAAGLKRLGLEHRISRYFSPEEMVPAAGQGVLAVQGIAGEDYEFLKGFFHEDTTYAALAERSFIETLGGGCTSPAAAYARVQGTDLFLTGFYYREDTKRQFRLSIEGKVSLCRELGKTLAHKMMEL